MVVRTVRAAAIDQQARTYRSTPTRGHRGSRDKRDIGSMASSMPVVRSSRAGRGRARFARVLAAREGGGDRPASTDHPAHSIWKVCDVRGLWIAPGNMPPIAASRGWRVSSESQHPVSVPIIFSRGGDRGSGVLRRAIVAPGVTRMDRGG